MNAYFVDAGELMCEVDRIEIWPIYEPVRICDLVVAPTRGRAKSLFVQAHRKDDIEFTDIKSVRLVAKNVDYPEGIVGDDPGGLRLWAAYSRLIGDAEAAEEEEQTAAWMEEQQRLREVQHATCVSR